MKFVELKKSFVDKIYAGYILYGEDAFLLNKSISLIYSACNIQSAEFDCNRIEGESFDIHFFKSVVNQYPFLSDKKLIIINDLQKLNSTDKKEIETYFQNPFQQACVVFNLTNTSSDVLAFLKNLENCTFVDCNRIDNKTIFNLVRVTFNQKDIEIDDECVQKLISYCNGYLTKIMVEIEKLCDYAYDTKKISSEDIDQLVNKDEEFQIFELFDNLAKKNAEKSFKILDKFISKKGDNLMVLPLMINYFRRVFISSISDSSNQEIAGYFNVKEYAVTKSKQQAINFSKLQLKKIYEWLLDYDYQIKSGKCTLNNALYIVASKILSL